LFIYERAMLGYGTFFPMAVRFASCRCHIPTFE